jgi:thiopeptide-type bacteriocin biosynthesis protein
VSDQPRRSRVDPSHSALRLRNPRSVIDRVIERFDAAWAHEITAAGGNADAVAELAGARELFLCGGAEALERCANPGRWLQIGVRFDTDSQREAFLDAALAKTVQRWRHEGLVDDFFFMNKPPGIRLRFSGYRVEARLRPRVFKLLDARQRDGRLRDYELGAYDGETYQFGGSAGLALFHRFSTIDCLAILRLTALARQTRSEARLACISLLCLNHLIRQFASGEWELWDVWCNMRLAERTLVFAPGERADADALFEAQRPLLSVIVFDPVGALASLTKAERRLVSGYQEQVTKWSEDVRAAIRRGELLYGMRTILPFYVIFHWNRLGVDWNTQSWLTFYMQRLLDPKCGPPTSRAEGRETG